MSDYVRMDKPKAMSTDVNRAIKLPIPRKFNGDPSFAKEFLSSLLTYFEFDNLKPKDQLFALPAFFTGKAYVWFQSLDDITKNSLYNLENAFKSKYIDTNENFLKISFFASKQKSNQSLDDYVHEIEKHSIIGDLPDTLRCSHFISGLVPNLRECVMGQMPTTYSDALEVATYKNRLLYKF